jgi:hypothetical protein
VDELQLQPCPSDFGLVNFSHFAKKNPQKNILSQIPLFQGKKLKKIQKKSQKIVTINYNMYARVIKILRFHVLNIAKFGSIYLWTFATCTTLKNQGKKKKNNTAPPRSSISI